MMNFLSQNELCYSIFSIKLDDHVQFSSLRPKLRTLIPKGKFPILNFKKYQNDYKNGVDFFILLNKYSFSFQFDKDFLDELSRQESQTVNEISTSPDYIVLIVLHSFITWYINFIKNHTIADIIILLRSLLVVMNIKNCKVVSKSRFYAASAFMNVYSEIVESTYITNIIDIFPPIVEFLTMNNDLPSNSFDLLLKLGNRVIDPSSTKFTKEMFHFVNFVVIIIRTCGNRCPSYLTSPIVSLMSNSLIGLDKDALSFFGRSIKTLGIDTAYSIISEFPDSIMAKITSNPNPIFECDSIKNDNGLVFPANDVVFEKKLVTFPTLEADIRKLIKIPPYFPELLSPKDLISNDLLEIFELICKITENDEKLKKILITKICSLLSSCPLSSHYYDISSAFLYFLLLLMKDSSFKCFPKDIFMSHLFQQNETIFEQGDEFQKINSIRHLAFLLLIDQPPKVIFKTLLIIRLKPYTFAEFVYRLLPDMKNLSKFLEISVPVFEGVMNAIVFYQKFPNISEELKKASCEARIAGFTYIDIMLRIPDFRKKFFESSMCVDAMISLVFEKSVRNWSLLRIIDAFYLSNTSFDYLIESCLKVFQISCAFGFTKTEIQQLESLFRFLDHEVFNSTNRIDLLKCFEPVISSICGWIAGLIKNASNSLEPTKSTSSSVPSSPTNRKVNYQLATNTNKAAKTPPRHRPIPHFNRSSILSPNSNKNTNLVVNKNLNSDVIKSANSVPNINTNFDAKKRTNPDVIKSASSDPNINTYFDANKNTNPDVIKSANSDPNINTYFDANKNTNPDVIKSASSDPNINTYFDANKRTNPDVIKSANSDVNQKVNYDANADNNSMSKTDIDDDSSKNQKNEEINTSYSANSESNQTESINLHPRNFHRHLKRSPTKKNAPSSSPSTPHKPFLLTLSSDSNAEVESDTTPEIKIYPRKVSCSPPTPRRNRRPILISSMNKNTSSSPKERPSSRAISTPRIHRRKVPAYDSSPEFEAAQKSQTNSDTNRQLTESSESSQEFELTPKSKSPSQPNHQLILSSDSSSDSDLNEKDWTPKRKNQNYTTTNLNNNPSRNKINLLLSSTSSTTSTSTSSTTSTTTSSSSSNLKLSREDSNENESQSITIKPTAQARARTDSVAASPRRIRRRCSHSKVTLSPNSSMTSSSQKVESIPNSTPASPFFPPSNSHSQSNADLEQNELFDSSSTANIKTSTNVHSNSVSNMKPKPNSPTNQTQQLSNNSRAYYTHLLNKLMNILTRFSGVHTLTQSDISLIDTTANFLYKSEPSDEFFKRLICSIAGEFLQSTEPSFDIKQPKAMKLLITLFNRSTKLLSKIDYIVSLCNYSTKNCEQLQKGEFDLFLVGRLFILRNDECVKKEVFTRALLILRLISAHSCSVSFVHQYVSLFCPIDCKYLPRFHQEILDSMQILLQNSGKVPATPLPLLSTTQVVASKVNLTNSFTIFFWFFIYSNEVPINVVEICNDSRKFSIQFYHEHISLFYHIKPEQWSGSLSFDLPLNQWCLATFSVQNDSQSDKAIVRAAINGNILPLTVFPYFDFSQCSSTVNVGITECDKLSVLLGSFGITTYSDPTHNISLYDAGPRKVPQNPLFFFTSHNKNDNFEIDVIPSSVSAKIQTVRSLHKPSFTDILIDICGVSILVPIIGNIDLAYKNGQKLPFLLEQFIEMLEMSLTLSYNSQRLFASEKSFLIISNILRSSKRVELNYKVFFRFVSLFELLDNEKCRSQLLFGILMKFDLWIRCDAFNLKRILRYWDYSLVPLHLSFVEQKIKFNDIVAALRIFFWYEPIENEIILHTNDRIIYKTNDIRTCRKHLLSIAFMMAMEGLTNREFKFIISQILSLEDKEQIFDLLYFLNDLIDNHVKVAQKTENVFESLVYLMFLYSTDLNILELTLSIVIKTYHLSLIKEMSLVNHIDIMIHELPGSYAYPPIFMKLIEICSKKEPKLFSLCSMMAFSLGQSSFINLLEFLKPNVLYCSNPFWSLWSIISLFKINDPNFQNRLISFLIDISPQQWKNIFWTIENVGRALKFDQEKLKKKFILELSNYLLKFDDLDELFLRQYFVLVPQFLFLRSYYQHNDYLKALYHKSYKKKRIINKSPSNNSNSINKPNDDELNKSNSNSFGDFVTPVRPRLPKPQNYEPKKKRPRMSSMMAYGKRSSYRSFDSISFTSTREKFMNLDVIKFKIGDLISLFNDVVDKVNYKVYFGLRINEENKWEDIDVARISNQLFKKYPRQIYYNSCLFINAFMLHYDPEDAIETINSLKANNSQIISYECSLYNKHADILHYQKIYDEQPPSYYSKSYHFLQQFENMYHDNNTLVNTYKSLTNNEEKGKKLHFNYEIDISQISTEIISDFKENLNLRNTKYTKFWTHFWRAMTIGRAPWRQSLSESQKKKEIYFKRDFIFCSSMCPFRMRPNYAFDNHKKASQKRDEGLSNGNVTLGRSGTLLSVLGSQSSLSQTKSLFNISNMNLLDSEQSKIFNINDQMNDSSSENVDTTVSENSKCLFESTCEIITVSHHYEALFSLQKECVVITKSVTSAVVIKKQDITAVLLRTVLHRETAIEIFLDDGISYFVNFPEIKSIDIIKQFKVLKKSLQYPFFLQIQPPKQLASFSKCTQLWQNRKISNFDYLMILNILSGRSFNDPRQYPYLPWIIKDYKSTSIDLNNPDIYRDLSMPAGSLGKEKFEQLKKSMEGQSYLYSSGNVSPLVVFLWLVRVEPFTTLQIKDQDDRFDSPDRQFKSIDEAFQSVLTLSSDFRELIPEFFFLPEFLVNMNNFDLGISNGKRVNDVELPKWINTDSKPSIVAAYEFIYLHRKALESDHVSAHLNEWIDLIWGDKSRGQKAIEFNNVYSPEMYPEIWQNDSELELEDNIPTIEAILSYVGQIPTQLFDKPHPQRCCNVEKTVLENIICFQIRSQKCKISIGAVIFLSDMKTVAILAIDELGACTENDIDINYLQKSSNDYSNDDDELIKQETLSYDQTNNPSVQQKAIHRASSPKFISFLNQNEPNMKSSYRKSIDSSQIHYQNFEKGSSHFDPATFSQTIWKHAFPTSFSSMKASLFVPRNGFNMHTGWGQNNGSAPSNLLKKFFIVDSNQNSDLYLVDPKNGQSERIVRQHNDITAISTDGYKWLAVANKDSKIYLYSLDEINKPNSKNEYDVNDILGNENLLKVEFSFPSFRYFVKCCDISTTFHNLVCGTRDNSLMICSMTSHSIIKIVELDAKPIHLVITPSWGFIVVYMRSISEGKSKHYLAVYGTNGYLLKKVEIENAIKKIIAWKDEKGFDFVLFTDSQNKIFVFEAFYCKIGSPLYEASSNVVDLAYMESYHAAVALCEDAMVYFIPVSFN